MAMQVLNNGETMGNIRQKINSNFSEVDSAIKEQKQKLEDVEQDLDIVEQDLDTAEQKLKDVKENIENLDKVEKYVVVAVAGQSNAVGYDESPVDTNFLYNNMNNKRIKQLGFYGEDNLKFIDLSYCAQNMQDMREHNRKGQTFPGTKGIHLPLANLMLDYIPEDYGVLILPIAFGGTGFTSGNELTYDSTLMKPSETGAGKGTVAGKWGYNTAYYKTLRDRIMYAVGYSVYNLFAGIVWCQGENDKSDSAGHKAAFEEMTSNLFRELNEAGYGDRTPKGTFDKDIWYNMETVYSWYTRNQCQQIWDNYKTWNPNTYVEIPRSAESNEVNGTGQTASNRPDHFGNNAYQKVVAPRVLQKMIDMNTFAKKVDVVTPEVEVSGDVELPVNYVESKLAVQSDVTTKSSVVFTIDNNGNCTADQELQGKFVVGTSEPCVYFGDIYKMEWEATRNLYWLIIEGDLNGNLLLLGLGGNMTGQLAKITNNSLSIVDNASNHTNKHYSYVVGDKIRVFRNNDKSLSIYRTNKADGVFHSWFEYPCKNIFEPKALGFACGISSAEFNSPFNTDKTRVFAGMKIQKSFTIIDAKTFDTVIENIELTPGPKGDTGPQGPQGDTGPQGPQGLSGLIIPVNTASDGTNLTVSIGDGYTFEDVMNAINNGRYVALYDSTTWSVYNLDRYNAGEVKFVYKTTNYEYQITLGPDGYVYGYIDDLTKYFKSGTVNVNVTTTDGNGCIPLIKDSICRGFLVFEEGKVVENAKWLYLTGTKTIGRVNTTFSETQTEGSERCLCLHNPNGPTTKGKFSYLLIG